VSEGADAPAAARRAGLERPRRRGAPRRRRRAPPGRRAPDRLARFVAAHDLPALVAACEDSPSAPVCHGAHQLRRLIRAGQAQVYQRVMPDLPVAVADPFFRLDLTKAAARAGLDLCAPG